MVYSKQVDSLIMMNAISYDLGPNELFQSIEAKQWDFAIEACKESAPQAEQWHFRFQDKSDKLRWKALPIHAAMIHGAPVTVIEALIRAYPKGIEEPDDQGLLPLHLAFRCSADNEVLSMLVRTYPAAVHIKDSRNHAPLSLIPTASALRWMKYANFGDCTAEHQQLLKKKRELEEKIELLLHEKREFEKELHRDKEMSRYLKISSLAIEDLKISEKFCVSTTMVGANDFLN
eukprot:CAMPEP_0172417296 /NCGR_PEP_ID=MMETSP1064-20121228/3826_1 /TAXON_ID=202472 /ORGANISM="Aulacoseira subarctica , Strain CCAP 1002/5" /LENGTH=231 /DNA_ID=CAMNT_0013155547 /DNA_START=20 /DNA_END=715 /DNA_ORIENTATION=-